MNGAKIKKVDNKIIVKIKKGLDIPIAGEPGMFISTPYSQPTEIALMGKDYTGMKPSLLVKEGDAVKKGQPLFFDKKNEKVFFTSPASGKVKVINRGEKRIFESIVISLSGDEKEVFETIASDQIEDATAQKITQFLLKTGLWPSIRNRPFSKTAIPGEKPKAIFLTVTDSNPLAPQPLRVIKGHEEAFELAIKAVQKLTDGPVYLCKNSNVTIPGENISKLTIAQFEGPHPSGLVGTHIHFLHPVSENNSVWHIDYQDLIAIGETMLSGELYVDRVIALAGPKVEGPTLVRTRIGAKISEIARGRTDVFGNRLISGNVLSGRTATGSFNYLGKFHKQVVALEEGTKRELLGWQKPGFTKFSLRGVFASRLLPLMKFNITTSLEGSHRAMVPIGNYEKVMPLDILPTYLLRALEVKDTETAQELGALELDEEDLSLCTFVCPGKNNFEDMLRENLTIIEKEG